MLFTLHFDPRRLMDYCVLVQEKNCAMKGLNLAKISVPQNSHGININEDFAIPW